MSTRSVKFNNKQQQHYQHQRNHGNQHTSKPMNPIIPKNQKNNHTIQQPKKKLQAPSSPPPQQHKQRRRQKKYSSDEDEEEESHEDHVYAGPTFSNAPAPSALPIPAFNARGSPINYHQPISLQQQSMDLMNLIAPQRVITAYELEKTNLALSEIQQGLRSMLKIES